MKISVMHSNLRRPFEEALDIAVELGLDGIHLSCGGELDARATDREPWRRAAQQIRDRGLEVSALCCWGGQVDLGEAEHHAENIAWGKQLLEMCATFETRIWMAHVGVMPHDASGPKWQAFVDATGELARYGESLGCCVAMETGPEPPRVMRQLIETVGGTGLRANYDPANLILWPVILREWKLVETPYDQAAALAEFMPTEGAAVLGPYIAHTHAKDALTTPDGKRLEVPLGEGLVDWQRYLRLLHEAGFDGYLAIERETGADPVGDIRRAATFLREQLALAGLA
ncbi:MAG: sugar phosphate isomerase/epimerase [Fimbriimonadaceae bacterium]|nr:sugar phosphate isomerase/epimerase [Fimbriimonadaceae bacterium]